tara:strand:+ start:246 stop:596 length:351 start_codon:yes stop_codon:yes gene_type:complete
MHYIWLAKMEDDTIFIITLVVVLIVVIGYLVLGKDDTIRLDEQPQDEPLNETEFRKSLLERIDKTNDLLISIRNSSLLLIVMIVVIPMLFMLFSKGCNGGQRESSVHVSYSPNTYN